MSNTISSPYPVIYAFGDSLSDGGDAYLVTNSKYASTLGYTAEPVSPPYYQMTYANGLTANEFSNGPVWVQVLAQDLGLATPAPATVGANANTLITAVAGLIGGPAGSLEAHAVVSGIESALNITGANPYIPLVQGASSGATDFAIGGSVTGVTPENNGAAIPLSDLAAQVTNFSTEVTSPLPGALYTIWSGSNDLLNLLSASNFSSLSASQINTDVLDSAVAEANAVSSLISKGAQNFLVLTVPDLGKVPAITMNMPTDTALATQLASNYNTNLMEELAPLSSATVHITIENTFAIIDNGIANPGTLNVTQPVYTGSFTSDSGTLVSTNPAIQDQYLFFDQQHPTETGQIAIANGALAALGLTCFVSGTRIATPRGPVSVEALAPGDIVTLATGGQAPVIWTGARTIDCAQHLRPSAAWPVRVRAGAFGPGAPDTDLFLSPDHAIYAADVLIPVRWLIDGDLIAQVPSDVVTYHHIELPQHGVVLAEGLPCESFLDTGQRDTLIGKPSTSLHLGRPDRDREARAYAPLHVTGPRVDRVRLSLRRDVAA